MVLNAQPTHPSSRCYVIKLHRDAEPLFGKIFGRLEHVVTGEAVEFATKEDLLTKLMHHAEGDQQVSTEGSTRRWESLRK
jgi:hypothetical protein